MTVTLTSLNPSIAGPGGGGTCTLSGSGFQTGPDVPIQTLNWGGSSIPFTIVSNTTITATIPSHAAGSINVQLLATGDNSGTKVFSYSTPSPTSISPNHGPIAGGTSVTITGSRMFGASGATVGGVSLTSFVSVSDTTCTGITGSTGSYTTNYLSETIRVTVDASSGSSGGVFNYDAPPPVFNTLSPVHGPAGGATSVTISGSNYVLNDPDVGVNFGSTPATSVTVASVSSITCVSPAGSGLVSVTVFTLGGSNTQPATYQYDYVPGTGKLINQMGMLGW